MILDHNSAQESVHRNEFVGAVRLDMARSYTRAVHFLTSFNAVETSTHIAYYFDLEPMWEDIRVTLWPLMHAARIVPGRLSWREERLKALNDGAIQSTLTAGSLLRISIGHFRRLVYQQLSLRITPQALALLVNLRDFQEAGISTGRATEICPPNQIMDMERAGLVRLPVPYTSVLLTQHGNKVVRGHFSLESLETWDDLDYA